MASEWDLKEMIIWKILPNDQLTPIYFPFNQWLGGKTKRLKSKAEIYRSKDHRIRGKIGSYMEQRVQIIFFFDSRTHLLFHLY